jgi:hypothetical protein
MSIRSKIGITIILSLGIVLLIGWTSVINQGPQPSWKGKIVTENGVKIVKNPAEPLYGELILQLEEDLSIGGNENDDNYYFPKRVQGLTVDDEGNIYVTDGGNRRIQKYDKTGKYVQTIGRRGQGPGEFQSPGRILFDNEGNLCVYDSAAIHFFHKDGTFIKKVVLKTFINDPLITVGGFVYGITPASFQPGGPKESIPKMDSEGTLAQTVAEFQVEYDVSRNIIAWHGYSNHLSLSPISLKSFCYGYSAEYKIYLADSEGKTILTMTKDEKPTSITSEEKAAIRKVGPWGGYARPGNQNLEDGIVFPPHRPYFTLLQTDGASRIFVMRRKSVLDKSSEMLYDIFCADGYYLYKMRLGFRPIFMMAGFIYEARENKETGDITIVRHKIKNWDQIKEGI